VAAHIEQTKFENCKQADRPRTYNQNVGFYRFGHVVSNSCRVQVRKDFGDVRGRRLSSVTGAAGKENSAAAVSR